MARKPIKRVPTPREANTNDKICAMPRDNWTSGHFWMTVDTGRVYLYHQPPGEPAIAKIVMPKRAFNKFVDAYNTGKTTKSAARGVGA